MNMETPRVFIAATRQNDGKTTTSLGLMAALHQHHQRIGYIKPVGQRFVDKAEGKIDEDTVLMDQVYKLDCPLVDMSPIAIEPDFTRRYLESANNDALIRKLQKAFDRVAWEKEFVLCEGSGHAGVGSVFDLSNARVAKILGCKVIIVSQGGIGRPIDEVSLNQALFEKEGVEIIGVIINKVLPDKMDYIAEFARKGLKRKGLELLGVVPHQRLLSSPTMESICEELVAEPLNKSTDVNNLVEDLTLGVMGSRNLKNLFRKGVCVVTPGDSEDVISAAGQVASRKESTVAGLILTGDQRPGEESMRIIRDLPYPVLMTSLTSFQVASRINNLMVKTRATDTQKIDLIRDLIAKHVDVKKILSSI